MAIFDTFDGTDGQTVASRPGWIAIGTNLQPVINGAGGVRTLDTSKASNTGLTAHNTSDPSHFAEAVIGTDALSGVTDTMDFVCVKTAITGSDYAQFYSLVYSVDTGTLRLRQATSNIASFVTPLVAGDTLRLEAQMNPEGTAVNLTAKVNGVTVIGPVSRTSFLANNGAGFRARTWRAHNPVMASFSAGALSETVTPVLSDATASATGTSTASASVVTNTGNGNLRFLTTTSPTATATEIKNSGESQGVTQSGVFTVTLAGLAASTTYYVHFLHEAVGGDSNVIRTAAFTTEALSVQLALGQLKNNTGTLLANQTGATVHVYNAATGDKVVTKTGQSTDVSGAMAVQDGLIVSGTQYRAVIVLASGAEGLVKATAA